MRKGARALRSLLASVAGLAGAVFAARRSSPSGTRPAKHGRRRFPGNVEYDGRLVFVRIEYNMGLRRRVRAQCRGSRGEPPWMHDYPTSDIHMMKILKELTLAAPARSTARTS